MPPSSLRWLSMKRHPRKLKKALRNWHQWRPLAASQLRLLTRYSQRLGITLERSRTYEAVVQIVEC